MAMGWGIGQNHHPLVSMIFIKNYGITEFYYFWRMGQIAWFSEHVMSL